MKRTCLSLIILGVLAVVLAGCGDRKTVRHLPHQGDTPYQADSILVAYGSNPQRALTLLDSAQLLGNISDYRAQYILAKIYSRSFTAEQQDSAIQMCKALLSHDSVKNAPSEQEEILDMLIAVSRSKRDDEAYLQWATKKAEICLKQGETTEYWRTEADIGLLMTFFGQVDEGLEKLDEAIGRLDSPGSIDRMDAFIIAVKRKINALNELNRYEEVPVLAQRILDRLDHYEKNAKDYAEDSYRLSWSDNPNDRDRYLDFSRAQAWIFMAQGYALMSEKGTVDSEKQAAAEKARQYLALVNQTGYGKSFGARRMIAPVQMALGMYDEALSIYDEVERRMGSDTLNVDYATILRSRAVVARSKGQVGEACDYLARYASLTKVVSDSLHRSEAHEYAARYHAQQQQMEIQEKEAEAERSHLMSAAVGVMALLALVFALYSLRQKHIMSSKNRVLVRMINEQMATPEKQKAETGTDAELFKTIDTAIREERLYTDGNLQRQAICDRFGISRHVLNALMTDHADGCSFPQYVNNIRLEEALRMLRDEPEKSIASIAAEVGFTPPNLREQFKRKYGMSPVEYRQNG